MRWPASKLLSKKIYLFAAILLVNNFERSVAHASDLCNPILNDYSINHPSNENIQKNIWQLRLLGLTEEAKELESTLANHLKNDEVISSKLVGRGTSEPRIIHFNGSISGIFKWNNNEWGRNRFKSEIAAFYVDRLLNLNIVPTTVARKYNGKWGSVQYFMTGYDIEERGSRTRLSNRINFFDYLIANQDRGLNGANHLVKANEPAEVAIDHGKAFSDDPFLDEIQNLDRIIPSKKDYERLKSISNADFESTLRSLLPKSEIQALIRRKNALIQAIDKRYPDGKITFSEEK